MRVARCSSSLPRCELGERPEKSADPKVDPEVLHIGLVVANAPAQERKGARKGGGRARRRTLFLCCPSEEAEGALPLLYLLRAKLQTGPEEYKSLSSFGVCRIAVLAPNPQKVVAQEEGLPLAAAGYLEGRPSRDDESFDLHAELEWYPFPCRSSVKGGQARRAPPFPPYPCSSQCCADC